MTARDDGWSAGRPGVPDEPGRRGDGGNAFPTPLPGSNGMTLRDWLAGQALTGLLGGEAVESPNAEWFADQSYRIADAMLAARSAR